MGILLTLQLVLMYVNNVRAFTDIAHIEDLVFLIIILLTCKIYLTSMESLTGKYSLTLLVIIFIWDVFLIRSCFRNT